MPEALIQLLAGRRGHFRMESGYHSDQWFELGPLFARPRQLQPFISELAARLRIHGVDAVCGPETGGARLAQVIAHELGLAAFSAERFAPPEASGLFPVKYQLPGATRALARGKSFAVVDDAISAGSAIRGTCADLIACGARPVALGALFVFGEAAARFAQENGLALEAIASMRFGMWPPDECPLCQAGIALEKVAEAG